MGKRSGVPDHEEDLHAMTLEELNREISRVEGRLCAAPTTYLRKEFFKQLVWMEAHREAVHGIPAPMRVMRARQR